MRAAERAEIVTVPLQGDGERRRWYTDRGDECLVWSRQGRLLEPLPVFGPSGYRLLAVEVSFREADEYARANGYHHLRSVGRATDAARTADAVLVPRPWRLPAAAAIRFLRARAVSRSSLFVPS